MGVCKVCDGKGEVNDFHPEFKKELKSKSKKEVAEYKKALKKNVMAPWIIKIPCLACAKTGQDLKVDKATWEKIRKWENEVNKWKDVTANTPRIWIVVYETISNFGFDEYIKNVGFEPPFEQYCSKKNKCFILDLTDMTITGIGNLDK